MVSGITPIVEKHGQGQIPHSSMAETHPIMLEELCSSVVKLKKVPKKASQTMTGQKLIPPLVNVPWDDKAHAMKTQFAPSTMEEFGLKKSDA